MESTRFKISQPLERLPKGEPFMFNYQPSRLDRNALFALGQVFSKDKISEVRTQLHRAHLNIDDLRKDLEEFDCPKQSRNHTDAYYMALYSVKKDLSPKQKLIPITTGAVVAHPNFPGNKSPGLPEKLEGYATKAQAVADPRVLQRIRQTWYDIEAGKKVELPDVACYARAQVCTRAKNKIRATWGYPLTVYLQEGAYFYPILEHLKQLENPLIAYGMEIGNGGMDMIETAVRDFKGSTKLMGDWSRFDKTIPPWLIRDAFNILREWIDWDQIRDSEGKLWPVRGYRSRRRWRRMVDYFINTPVRLSDGTRYIKHGGVPSGTCFTNVIDSIVNAIVMRYLTYDITGELPLFDVYLGDDSLVVLREPINLEYFAELAYEQFSMVFNADKGYQTTRDDNIHFLGYYNISGFPYKPIDSVIASSIYPERPARDKLETIVRLVGQAYSCFDASDASNFFRAAQILSDEEGLERAFIEEHIHRNPQLFKYLLTIGLDPKTISFPRVKPGELTFITYPHPARKKIKTPTRDVTILYQEALEWFHHQTTLLEKQDMEDAILQ